MNDKDKEIGELARLINSTDMPSENGWCVSRACQYEARILAKAIINAGYRKGVKNETSKVKCSKAD